MHGLLHFSRIDMYTLRSVHGWQYVILTILVRRRCINVMMCPRKKTCASRQEDNEFLLELTTMQNSRLGKVKQSKLSYIGCCTMYSANDMNR